jgi:glycopeptide antibiotics resistance protein
MRFWESGGGGGCRRDLGTWSFSLMLALRWAAGEVIGVSGGDAVPSFKLAAGCRAAFVLGVFLPMVCPAFFKKKTFSSSFLLIFFFSFFFPFLF